MIIHFIEVTNIIKNQKVFEDSHDSGILVKYYVVYRFQIIVVLFDCEFLSGLANLSHVSRTLFSWNQAVVAPSFCC